MLLPPASFLSINPDGTQEVNPDSPLGHHIKNCNNRLVPYGRASADVAADLSASSSGLLSNLASFIPDLAQISSALSDLSNAPWISGTICVNFSENPRWDSEIKWYAQYESLQRNLENSGVLSRSSTYAVLEDYYEKNPLDNTPTGILARYSGLSKSDVVAALDYLDVMTYLATYDASSRQLFSTPTQTPVNNVLSSSRSVVSKTYPAPSKISSPSLQKDALKLASAYAKIALVWKEKENLEISRRLEPAIA